MASRSTIQREKERLSATLAARRAEILPAGSFLAGRLGPARGFRGAMRRSPLKLLGFTCAGAAITTLLVRRGTARRRRGKGKTPSTPGLLFRWVLNVSQPVAKLWILAKAREQFANSRPAEVPESLPRP